MPRIMPITYLSRYVRGGPIKDSRILEADGNMIKFRYRDHHDNKSKVMSLKRDHFIGRVLTHVPVKGRHLVRYYGLYTPGAQKHRDTVRKELGMGEEKRHVPEKKTHQCPECGGALFHYLSRRCRNSYIKSKFVQQVVQADHTRAVLREYLHAERPPTFFFGRAVAA